MAGYRLKEFEDDPVKLANKDAKEASENPVMNWFNALDNPLVRHRRHRVRRPRAHALRRQARVPASPVDL